MDSILTTSDFTGLYALPSNYDETRAQAIISEVERDTFRKMMGDDAYVKLLDAITISGNPDPANDGDIDDWFGGVVSYEVDGVKRIYDKGFSEAIKCFAWFEIMRDNYTYSTNQGILTGMSDNGEKASGGFDVLKRMWNNGREIYDESKKYIEDYMIDVLGKDDTGEIFENYVHSEIKTVIWL